MHVVQVSFYVDPQARPPRELLRQWTSLGHIAGAVADNGDRVTVVQASQHRERFHESGVEYCFLPPDTGGLASSGEFAQLIAELVPDVFHVHGLSFGHEVRGLRRLCARTPILLQDHADRVPRFWRRGSWRSGLACADGVSFCARGQAEAFVAARLLPPHTAVFEIAESTSEFSPGDRAAARTLTGIHGDPALLWVGHLDSNKDPLTVLTGISAAVERLPGLTLWCCFATAPLREEVEQLIAGDPRLQSRVHLLGRVEHARIETLMRAADLFVLGSHREGSGYSLMEALACALPPVVTDIPSFRMLTDAGRAGWLWKAGDAASLTAALLQAARAPRAAARDAARRQFEARSSRAAVGRGFGAAYRRLAARRAARGSHG
ncbi:MAG TPA: glycosyltransferase family 4 protein [Steroidobacteraceae bacterium]|nr:glycosyltransferase family 4 protein [Steroidobacteraceae bacterium]